MAKAKWNCSNVSGIARLRLAGLPRTGQADLSAENGSGSTPRKGAGSMATVAEASPRTDEVPYRVHVGGVSVEQHAIPSRIAAILVRDEAIRQHLG